MQISKEIEELSRLTSSMGLIMKTGESMFQPIKLALEPYIIKKELYQLMGSIHKVWQKLVFQASKDNQLIRRTFHEIAKIDDMISNLYRIYLKSCQIERNDSLIFTRIDFFKNTDDELKIIQYNLTSVSMASHTQNFARAMKLLNVSTKRNIDFQYPQNNPATDISQAVQEIYKLKNLKGIFLMIITANERNIVDQSYVQIKLLQKGIKSRREKLCALAQKIQKIGDKLIYEGQQVSMVYYRAGYQPSHYCETGNFKKCWQARQLIQLSDAIKIPNIKMQLMNQKRMQVQLSKQEVYRKYLSEAECRILKKSLVYTTDFEENQNNKDYLNYMQEKGLENFILKPNLQGGGNNIYGQKAYQLLKSMPQQEKKKYILMQKIITDATQNVLFIGEQFQKVKCICELSRYGIIAEVDGNIIQNSCNGYLVRIKPQHQNQGGVMAGVGAIGVMAIKPQQQ